MTEQQKAAWVLPVLVFVLLAIFNPIGLLTMIWEFTTACFWPGLLALAIVAAVLALARR